MHRLPTGKIFASFQTQVEGPYHTNMTVDQLLRDVRQSRRASTSVIRPLRRGIHGTARVPDQGNVPRLLTSQTPLIVLVVELDDRPYLLRGLRAVEASRRRHRRDARRTRRGTLHVLYIWLSCNWSQDSAVASTLCRHSLMNFLELSVLKTQQKPVHSSTFFSPS